VDLFVAVQYREGVMECDRLDAGQRLGELRRTGSGHLRPWTPPTAAAATSRAAADGDSARGPARARLLLSFSPRLAADVRGCRVKAGGGRRTIGKVFRIQLHFITGVQLASATRAIASRTEVLLGDDHARQDRRDRHQLRSSRRAGSPSGDASVVRSPS
jgi:hypothetical protein